MESINPYNQQLVAAYEAHSDQEIDAKLETASKRADGWSKKRVAQRIGPLTELARLLRERTERYGRLMATEMGKRLVEGRSEIEKCAWLCDYCAKHAEEHLSGVEISSDASYSTVVHRPLGVVLAVMPWNFPFWQVFRFAVPALAAGNAAIVKHAPNTTGCALAIEALFEEAGFPGQLLQVVLIEKEDVADRISRLIGDSRIAAVTLTGSTRAGRSVASAAGKHLKKCVLELGGSDPYVVLEDADLEQAVEACVTGRLLNAGQSCIAAKRWILVGSVYEPFLERAAKRMFSVRMGDPLDEITGIGPLARCDLFELLSDQVRKSIDMGAREVPGGQRPGGGDCFYPPTILTDVGPGMPAYEQELFGPVAAVIRARSEDEALRIANDTSYGLGAAVFTGSAEKGLEIASNRLEAGACFVNTFVRSDPRLPFGGVKDSGYGRELGPQGILEFVNVKTVYVD